MVADFGCGEAQMAQTIPNQVHSFDLVAANDRVIACDMASVPLAMKVVDVVFYSYHTQFLFSMINTSFFYS